MAAGDERGFSPLGCRARRRCRRNGTIDYQKFIPLYPVFGRPNQQGITLSEETLHLLWEQADIFLDNTAGSQVRNVCMRQQLPFVLLAHMATLMGWPDNYPRGMLPGQLTSVSTGSVSLGMQSLIAQPATALATGTRACIILRSCRTSSCDSS